MCLWVSVKDVLTTTAKFSVRIRCCGFPFLVWLRRSRYHRFLFWLRSWLKNSLSHPRIKLLITHLVEKSDWKTIIANILLRNHIQPTVVKQLIRLPQYTSLGRKENGRSEERLASTEKNRRLESEIPVSLYVKHVAEQKTFRYHSISPLFDTFHEMKSNWLIYRTNQWEIDRKEWREKYQKQCQERWR